MQDNARTIAELLKVLANENRLLILNTLKDSPHNVGELAKSVPNITRSALSQHLTLLKAHGIVDYTKSGQNVNYSISDDRVLEILNVLQEFYC